MNNVNFLFELGTEELPPTALGKLSDAFADNVRNGLDDSNLGYSELKAFATPRRLAIQIIDLNAAQADSEQTRLGPALAAAFDNDGQPTKAAQGFARSCGLEVAELQHIDTEKGTRLGLTTSIKGKPARDILPDIIHNSLQSLPIPKGMRWGDRDETFVRPVKWISALIDHDVLDMSLFGCRSSNQSFGHRFMSGGKITINNALSYAEQLRDAHVIADQAERMTIIQKQVNQIAEQHKLNAVIDPDLLDEVSALVEWPVALMGSFEEEFLSVPKEALISTMSKNQKYFHLLSDNGELANRFITIANLESTNPAAIIAGNEKVIRPRLADAKFFYEVDSKQSLTHKAKKLESIVFQTKLGSVADKCSRLAVVAKEISIYANANTDKINKAAQICKADLVTEMVGEFPNLQGIMGHYYARDEGLDPEVCLALEEIYLPKSATDRLPVSATGICLAIADRIDTLVGIFGIKQIPSGNKDPYALRRAALGIIRIILEQDLAIDLKQLVRSSIATYSDKHIDPETEHLLLEFFASRARAMFLEQGYSAQEITAVEALAITSPKDFEKRLRAVKLFSALPEADSLSSANKRVANILAKNISGEASEINPELLTEEDERNLFAVYRELQQNVLALCQSEDYEPALQKLVSFSSPLERFFDSVMVMADDEAIKNNRIALLAGVRALFLAVADISRLQK